MIKIEIHHFHHFPKEDEKENELLTKILSNQQSLSKKFTQMADKFEGLQSEVAENTSVIQSAITVIEGMAASFEDAKDDPAQIQALVDELRTSKDALAQAVAANTPAEGDVPA